MYGSGELSTLPLTYIPMDIPGEVGIPDVSITSPTASSTTVLINWDKPEEHSSSITEYDVRFLTSTGTYARSTSECLGTELLTLSTTSCTYTMTEIISLTGLSRDQTIRVKIRAINDIGQGAYSELNTEGATIETVPTGSTTVSFDLDSTTNTDTVVEWTEITGSNRGGSSVSIDYYELQWNQGPIATPVNGTWEKLDDVTDLTYPVTGLSGGLVYRFRVRGYNKYGAGAWSSDAGVGVLTAQAPDAPAAPSVEYVTSQVRIKWTYPTSDNHKAVTAYEIVILSSDGTNFYENTTACDGSRSTIIASTACVFPMTYLREGSYDLVQGDDIIVKIRAYNSRGWSDYSTTSATGVDVRRQPHEMITPSDDSVVTNQAQIKVDWDTTSTSFDNGGSAVIAYNLQWDSGSGGSSWVDLVGPTPASTALTFTVSTGVVSGTSYLFRVRAANVYGWGDYSITPVTVKAAAEPGKVLSVSTTIDETTGSLKISWLPPQSNGAPIDSYTINIKDILL
jgi:hypothetical protein